VATRAEALGEAGQYNQGASYLQGSKLIQRKPRKIAWISLDSFGRFGAYQWVTGEKTKNPFHARLASRVVRETSQSGFPFFPLASRPRIVRRRSFEWEKIYHGFWILEMN
jgi:hypothetical protein